MTAATTRTESASCTAASSPSFVQRLGRWNSTILNSGSALSTKSASSSRKTSGLRVRFAPADDGTSTCSSESSAEFRVKCDFRVLPKHSDVRKIDLFVSPEEKIGTTDDADEVVYKYKSCASQYGIYLCQLSALWEACVAAKPPPDEEAADRMVQRVLANATSRCHPKVLQECADGAIDVKALVGASARGMERRLLVSTKASSSSSSSPSDKNGDAWNKENVVQKVLEAQTTLKRVPMMSHEHRAKLLRGKYKKYSLPHKLFAATLAHGDQQLANTLYVKAKLMDQSCSMNGQ